MALKAPTTVRRYAVSDRPREGLEAICARLDKRKFLPLDDAVEETERSGWITAEHLLDTRFTLERCVREPYVVFALRMDKRRVPAALVRAHLKIEEEAHRQATGKRMPPRERREMREEITLRLLQKVLPNAAQVPVIWSPNRQRVYFGSTGEKPNDLFRVLFEDTFELELTPLDPAGCAMALANGQEDLVRGLLGLVPTTFIPRPGEPGAHHPAASPTPPSAGAGAGAGPGRRAPAEAASALVA